MNPSGYLTKFKAYLCNPWHGAYAWVRIRQGANSLLKRFQLEVVIAGDDRVAYGSKLPPEGSFGRWAKRLLDASPRFSRAFRWPSFFNRLRTFTKEQSCALLSN